MRRIIPVVAAFVLAGCVSASPAPSAMSGPSAGPSSTAVPSNAARASRPEVWLAPMPYAPAGVPAIDGSADYDALFEGPERWPVASAATDVVTVYSIWVFAHATEQQLRSIVDSTARRGQLLALELGALTPTEQCGRDVEGFDATLQAVDRLHALGARIAVVAFDEPYYYGHVFDGEQACQWSVEKVAAEVASFVRTLRNAEPKLRVGDIEPLWGRVSPSDLGVWLDAYRAASGDGFDFLQVDVNWHRPKAGDWTAGTEAETAARGVDLGVIYNGPGGQTDKVWTDRARAAIATVEQRLGHAPAQVVFQSWEHWPRHALPETDSTTLTGVLRDYVVATGITR